ncbi:speckle-type POZ protein-like [Planococcus citri]|uniref:speckle-type POZ protein-like n=1 Tax=Planococcus citri TaxID=170843 RepID=UPI0031FA1667
MTNAMKMPFPIPPSAPEAGSIETRECNIEGEKAYIITWIIPDVRLRHFSMTSESESYLVSKKFTVEDDDGITLTWCLAFVQACQNDRLCYYLYLCFIPENDCKEAFLKIGVTFRDERSSKQFSTSVADCKFGATYSNSSLSLRIDSDVSSCITAHCTIIQPRLHKFSLSKDLGNVFKNQIFTDVKLLTNDGKVFKAHKGILSARSSVFAAMFTDQMKENKQNQVEIADMNGEVVQDMLRYIYTDKPEKLRLLAKDLFVAAVKYDLKGLKKMSEDALITNLSISNAVEILHFSELHNATRLKTDVVKFITTKKNVEVFKTEAWKSSEQTNLLKEICEVLANR